MSKGDFGVLPDQFGYGRKVINLGGILISERGKYTIDIFELGVDKKLKFIKLEDYSLLIIHLKENLPMLKSKQY